MEARCFSLHINPVPNSLPCLDEVDNGARFLQARPPHIEVLEMSKLRDGDAFRPGDDPVIYPPQPGLLRFSHTGRGQKAGRVSSASL